MKWIPNNAPEGKEKVMTMAGVLVPWWVVAQVLAGKLGRSALVTAVLLLALSAAVFAVY